MKYVFFAVVLIVTAVTINYYYNMGGEDSGRANVGFMTSCDKSVHGAFDWAREEGSRLGRAVINTPDSKIEQVIDGVCSCAHENWVAAMEAEPDNVLYQKEDTLAFAGDVMGVSAIDDFNRSTKRQRDDELARSIDQWRNKKISGLMAKYEGAKSLDKGRPVIHRMTEKSRQILKQCS